MKKIYLALLLAYPFSLLAQPTLVQSDLPFSGLAFTLGTDSTFNANIPAGGAGQTWDYTFLSNLLTDTAGWIPASGTPFSSTFSGSNLASYDQPTATYTYFTSNSTGFYIDGFASSAQNYVLSPPLCYVPTPFTYGDSRINVARNILDTTVVDSLGISHSLRNIFHISSSFSADGYGTLLLPNGTYQNTLRVRNTEVTFDSLFSLIGPLQLLISNSTRQSTYYKWYQHGGSANYLLGIKADSLGIYAVNSEYLLNFIVLDVPKSIVSVELKPYPNPSSDWITVQGSDEFKNGILELYDSRGSLMQEFSFSDSEEIRLDVRRLQNGLYHFNLKGSAAFKKGAFLVQH